MCPEMYPDDIRRYDCWCHTTDTVVFKRTFGVPDKTVVCKKQLKSGLFDGKWTVFVELDGHSFVFLHNSSPRNNLISFHHALRLGLDEQEILNRIDSNQF